MIRNQNEDLVSDIMKNVIIQLNEIIDWSDFDELIVKKEKKDGRTTSIDLEKYIIDKLISIPDYQ